jgi:Fe-S-cluster-containing hydrogenase component 2
MSRHLLRTDFVELDTRKCQACWRCVDACARQVIGKVSVLWHKHAKLRAGKDCTGCLKCVAVCPAKAMARRESWP